MRNFLCRVVAAALAVAGATVVQAAVDPSEGFWYDPDRPGTGFSLERRGELLAVTGYDFGEGQQNRWRLAVGALHDDALVATLQSFAGGGCLGCDEVAAAQPQAGGSTLRVQFDSARSATLQVDDAPPRRFVALPFGNRYVETQFAQEDVPLPDLEGRWLFVDDQRTGVLLIGPPELVEGAVVHPGGAVGLGMSNLIVVCEASDRTDSGSCWMAIDPFPHFAPPPQEIGRFRLGDIEEDRLTGVGLHGSPVVLHRIGVAEQQP